MLDPSSSSPSSSSSTPPSQRSQTQQPQKKIKRSISTNEGEDQKPSFNQKPSSSTSGFSSFGRNHEACEFCRSRHVSCKGRPACNNCTERGIPCVFTSKRKRGPKPKNPQPVPSSSSLSSNSAQPKPQQQPGVLNPSQTNTTYPPLSSNSSMYGSENQPSNLQQQHLSSQSHLVHPFLQSHLQSTTSSSSPTSLGLSNDSLFLLSSDGIGPPGWSTEAISHFLFSPSPVPVSTSFTPSYSNSNQTVSLFPPSPSLPTSAPSTSFPNPAFNRVSSPTVSSLSGSVSSISSTYWDSTFGTSELSTTTMHSTPLGEINSSAFPSPSFSLPPTPLSIPSPSPCSPLPTPATAHIPYPQSPSDVLCSPSPAIATSPAPTSRSHMISRSTSPSPPLTNEALMPYQKFLDSSIDLLESEFVGVWGAVEVPPMEYLLPLTATTGEGRVKQMLLYSMLATGAARLHNFDSADVLYQQAINLADVHRPWRTRYVLRDRQLSFLNLRKEHDSPQGTPQPQPPLTLEEELKELKLDESFCFGLNELLTASFFLGENEYLTKLMASTFETAEHLMLNWLRVSKTYNIPIPRLTRNTIISGISGACLFFSDEDRARYQELLIECFSGARWESGSGSGSGGNQGGAGASGNPSGKPNSGKPPEPELRMWLIYSSLMDDIFDTFCSIWSRSPLSPFPPAPAISSTPAGDIEYPYQRPRMEIVSLREGEDEEVDGFFGNDFLLGGEEVTQNEWNEFGMNPFSLALSQQGSGGSIVPTSVGRGRGREFLTSSSLRIDIDLPLLREASFVISKEKSARLNMLLMEAEEIISLMQLEGVVPVKKVHAWRGSIDALQSAILWLMGKKNTSAVKCQQAMTNLFPVMDSDFIVSHVSTMFLTLLSRLHNMEMSMEHKCFSAYPGLRTFFEQFVQGIPSDSWKNAKAFSPPLQIGHLTKELQIVFKS